MIRKPISVGRHNDVTIGPLRKSLNHSGSKDWLYVALV